MFKSYFKLCLSLFLPRRTFSKSSSMTNHTSYWIWGLCKFMQDLGMCILCCTLQCDAYDFENRALISVGFLLSVGYCASVEVVCHREKCTIYSGMEHSLLLYLLWCIWVICKRRFSVWDSSLQMEVTWNIFRKLRSLKTYDSASVRVFWG